MRILRQLTAVREGQRVVKAILFSSFDSEVRVVYTVAIGYLRRSTRIYNDSSERKRQIVNGRRQ